MSLATDILKRAETNLVPTPRQREQTKRGKIIMPKSTRVPGVSWVSTHRKWLAYYYDGSKTMKLGLHDTQERAFLAIRLFKLWRRRGFIPGSIPRCRTQPHSRDSIKSYT